MNTLFSLMEAYSANNERRHRKSLIILWIKAIVFLFLITCLPDRATGQRVEYAYDASGNRILRQVVVLASPAMSQEPESTQQERQKGEYQAVPEMHSMEKESHAGMHDDGERRTVIYPNPTKGAIRVEFQGYKEMNGARMLLYNMSGRLLLQVNIVERSNELDLSPYPSGMYILHIIEGASRSEWKIIKE